MEKKYLTTGDIAKILKVAPTTISKWIDRGKIKGWKVPGSGGYRRAYKSEVIIALKSWGMQINPEDEEKELIDILGVVYSTGQVAKICLISIQSVNRCFDEGTLKGFREPSRKERKLGRRRIPERFLYEFIRDNELPFEGFKDKMEKYSNE